MGDVHVAYRSLLGYVQKTHNIVGPQCWELLRPFARA